MLTDAAEAPVRVLFSETFAVLSALAPAAAATVVPAAAAAVVAAGRSSNSSGDRKSSALVFPVLGLFGGGILPLMLLLLPPLPVWLLPQLPRLRYPL